MKKIALVLALNMTVFAGFLSAETWECTYGGTWKTNGTGNSGGLNWKVTWVKQGAGWQLVGNMTDKYGVSSLNGSCMNKACTLTQTYSSGSLVGKPYVYTGTYVDQTTGDGASVNTFTGTWKGNNTTGAWAARANCQRQ